VFIPEGMSKAITHFVKNPVVELATWGRHTILDKLEICAVPAQHPGGRLFCRWRYPRCHGYVLTLDNESLYFAGDTAYRNDFTDLKNLFPIKTALLPAAQVYGSFYSRKRHMNIDDMIQCWSDLGSPDLIPYHWGSFFKIFNDPEKTEKVLRKKAAGDPLLAEKLHLLQNGESWIRHQIPNAV
ncbi:MAG: MBL fold metallo-hydrolase, partial [bacterium]|nr:MBL fold metallo-hydrolase [bacterium]